MGDYGFRIAMYHSHMSCYQSGSIWTSRTCQEKFSQANQVTYLGECEFDHYSGLTLLVYYDHLVIELECLLLTKIIWHSKINLVPVMYDHIVHKYIHLHVSPYLVWIRHSNVDLLTTSWFKDLWLWSLSLQTHLFEIIFLSLILGTPCIKMQDKYHQIYIYHKCKYIII